jgi:LPS export ABC transporter protein LptC
MRGGGGHEPRMKKWVRALAYVVGILVVAGAYFIGVAGRNDDAADSTAILPPDPGYAARDAVVTETGHDGRERYRLNAQVIRQQPESGVIDLENLEMDYHPGSQAALPGEKREPAPDPKTIWHLQADRGQVRANGDDVQLNGNVTVNGPAPGSELPLKLTTDRIRVNMPTEFIETDAPVKLTSSGNELTAIGMEADLKAGKVRLKSAVHGSSAN